MARRGRDPVLVINPSDDGDFGRRAQELVEAGAATPSDLEAALRAEYPLAVVHSSELSAVPVIVWYVYRDGRWVGRS